MPIVNCVVNSNCPVGNGDLIKMWAAESGQSSEHMTINIIKSIQQFGQEYTVMANLQLPSLWSDKDISQIQVGLANALAKYFDLNLNQVHIISNIVDSGLVVENGKELNWE